MITTWIRCIVLLVVFRSSWVDSIPNYAAQYKLTYIWDPVMNPVELPKKYDVKLRTRDKDSNSTLTVTIKVGNSLGFTIAVGNDTDVNTSDITVSKMWSTRMLPPPPIFRVETSLWNVIPELNSIAYKNGILTMKGPNGTITSHRNWGAH
jgi:hypothetical protein